MFYTVIKHDRHLRTRGKCRKHEPQASVFYISRVFSNDWSRLIEYDEDSFQIWWTAAGYGELCVWFQPIRNGEIFWMNNNTSYIKVSGIPSGKKLIKTIRYPHMWRYDIFTCEDIDDFTDIKFVSQIVLKFVGVSSKHLRVFLESLRQSSAIFVHLRKFSENVRKRSSGPSEQFWKIFGNLRKVVSEIFGKSSKTSSLVHYTLVRRYEFCVLVARTISHSFATLTREILFLPLEHKIHIFSPPCNILYVTFLSSFKCC